MELSITYRKVGLKFVCWDLSWGIQSFWNHLLFVCLLVEVWIIINVYNNTELVMVNNTELCHEKTDLKVFVVAIIWIWHRLLENKIYEVKRLKFLKVGVIPKEASFF